MTVTPPTFVAEYEASTWTTTTTPKTATPTIAANDCLIIGAITANDTTTVATPPTDNLGTSLTYNLLQTVAVTDWCYLRLWSALVTGGQSGSFTLSLARGGVADIWGFNCLKFSGVSAIGATAQNNGEDGQGNQKPMTTLGDNSVVVQFAGDWNAADGTTRTWRTVNSIAPSVGNGMEKTYVIAGGNYAAYAAYWSDTGAAGSKTFGMTAPLLQRFALGLVELRGITAGSPPPAFGSGFFDGI
jgi:hypothetical protein